MELVQKPSRFGEIDCREGVVDGMEGWTRGEALHAFHLLHWSCMVLASIWITDHGYDIAQSMVLPVDKVWSCHIHVNVCIFLCATWSCHIHVNVCIFFVCNMHVVVMMCYHSIYVMSFLFLVLAFFECLCFSTCAQDFMNAVQALEDQAASIAVHGTNRLATQESHHNCRADESLS